MMPIKTLMRLVLFVQERFPESHVICKRSDKVDFYNGLGDEEIPVVTIDLLSGRVSWLDKDVTVTSMFPAATLLNE